MKARFRALRLVAAVWKWIGWLALLAGLVLGALVAQGFLYLPLAPFAEPYSANSIIQGVVVFAPFFLGFLVFYSAGGILRVLMAIEEHTRGLAAPVPPGQPEVGEHPWEGEIGPGSRV